MYPAPPKLYVGRWRYHILDFVSDFKEDIGRGK
jgi:hypothetical protein